jgi:hypothetical protein
VPVLVAPPELVLVALMLVAPPVPVVLVLVAPPVLPVPVVVLVLPPFNMGALLPPAPEEEDPRVALPQAEAPINRKVAR